MGQPVKPAADARTPAEAGEVDAHLAHLFDYCLALLGSEDDAVRTALSVMAAAHALLDDPDRLRAWLFALARRRALGALPLTGEPPYEARAGAAASGPHRSEVVLSAFGELTYRDREVLDLVYRHGIHPADLPAVLGIPAEEAYRLLINAEEEFISLAADSGASAGADLDDIRGLPLAALPAPKRGRRMRGREVARDLPSAAGWRTLARRRLILAAAAVVLVAAVGWVVVYLAGPGHAGGPHAAAGPLHNAGSPAGNLRRTPNPSPAAQPKHSTPPTVPIALLLPAPRRSPNQGVTLLPPLVNPATSAPTSSPSASSASSGPPPSTPPPSSPPPSSPPPSSPPPSGPPPSSAPPSNPTS